MKSIDWSIGRTTCRCAPRLAQWRSESFQFLASLIGMYSSPKWTLSKTNQAIHVRVLLLCKPWKVMSCEFCDFILSKRMSSYSVSPSPAPHAGNNSTKIVLFSCLLHVNDIFYLCHMSVPNNQVDNDIHKCQMCWHKFRHFGTAPDRLRRMRQRLKQSVINIISNLSKY